jgi:hypothetical protein
MTVPALPYSPREPALFITGISYPQAGGPVAHGTRELTLLNGRKPAYTPPHAGPPSYSVSGGIVYLSGLLRSPDGSPLPFARLPRAARPSQSLSISVECVYRTIPGVAPLVIQPDGHLFTGCGTNIPVSLAGVAFPTHIIRSHQLQVNSPWQPAGRTSYAVVRDVVFLQGAVYIPNNEGTVSGVAISLPPRARPVHGFDGPIVSVASNGNLWLFSLGSGSVAIGLSFPSNS